HAAHELRDSEGRLLDLVHRDVSPQNLLVDYSGVVRVADFGIAQAASNRHKTEVGQLKGKVAYMSPEQGRAIRVDRRTDIFALGIVLYELATGHHPFRHESDIVTLNRICNGAPALPPQRICDDIPPELDRVIMRALAKNRDERYGSMAEFHRAL